MELQVNLKSIKLDLDLLTHQYHVNTKMKKISNVPM